jgi:hypothetical protein
VDSQGVPHLSFGEWQGNRLFYASKSFGAWFIEVVDNVGGRYSSLALDANGLPHIAYYDGIHGDLRYASRNGSWTSVPIDTDGDVGAYVSLALDNRGRVHLSYFDATTTALKYALIRPATNSEERVPTWFALHQNVPNPFNPHTVIHYDVPANGGHVQLLIFDMAGHLVRTLVDTEQSPGPKSATWDGLDAERRRVAAGVYLCKLNGSGFTATRKLTLLQ